MPRQLPVRKRRFPVSKKNIAARSFYIKGHPSSKKPSYQATFPSYLSTKKALERGEKRMDGSDERYKVREINDHCEVYDNGR